MRILIVEDEHKIAAALKKGLEQELFAVDVEYTAQGGVGMATTQDYDLIILDRMLPGEVDGIKIVQMLRERKNHTPVLLLTAKDKTQDRVEGLNAGADDYLVKPFAFEELLARIRAILRRPEQVLSKTLSYEDVTLDTQSFEVTRQGKKVDLTSKEFVLLEYLMRNQGRVVSKENIIQHVWDYDADILLNTVEVYVGYLRSKIDKPFSGEKLIHTRHGFGYYFGK